MELDEQFYHLLDIVKLITVSKFRSVLFQALRLPVGSFGKQNMKIHISTQRNFVSECSIFQSMESLGPNQT